MTLPIDKLCLGLIDPHYDPQSSEIKIKTALCESDLIFSGTLKVMLICSSDRVESFCTPGVWIRDQVRAICRDFGLVCIRRNGQDVKKMINDDDILDNFKDAEV